MDFARLMTFEDFNADFHCEKHPDIKAEVNRSVLYIYECHIKFHVPCWSLETQQQQQQQQ